MKVSTVEHMRELDRRAIEEFGIPEEILMENAALAAYEVIRQKVCSFPKRSFTLFCGVGNNGGDALALARKLHSAGAAVTVAIVGDPGKYKKAAKLNFEIAEGLNLPMIRIEKKGQAAQIIGRSDCIVDGIFGTGLAREVEGIYKEIIELINSSDGEVFSLDIPSGINGNTGQVMGAAVRADCTITFGLPKQGNILFPGFEYSGELFVTHISFPRELTDTKDIKTALNIPSPLPVRQRTGHKGTFGDVLFIAGASSYYGAPYFASCSFLKAGGGYSRLACPAPMVASLASMCSEVVYHPMEYTESGSLSSFNLKELLRIAEIADMVVMGPGLSLDRETQGLIRRVTEKTERPLLLDGDGLTAFIGHLDILKNRKSPTILTPHPGEFARLAGLKMQSLLENPIDHLRSFVLEIKTLTLLKSAHTLIGTPEGDVFINVSGNSGMGTAGSGDVLTGTIAAMYGLGLPLTEAVKTGVFVHGLAGDIAAQRKGEDGITAGDILTMLPNAVARYREEYSGLVQDSYSLVHSV